MRRITFTVLAAPFCIAGALLLICGAICFAPVVLLCPALAKDHNAIPAPMDAM